jgi:electron transfer flavoprotein beta subunit
MATAELPPKPTRQPVKLPPVPADLPHELLFDPPKPLRHISEGLNSVVCIKQVPHAEGLIVDPVKKTLKREGAYAVINPPDENAFEVAMDLKDRHGGRVTVLTMGPPQAEGALRDLMSRGADEAVLITDRSFAGADTYPTSLTLAAGILRIEEHFGEYVDLVTCGEETTDSSTGHVGPGIGEHLGYNQATFISRFEYDPEKSAFRAKRVLEGAYEIVETPKPCVITATLNMNHPRISTLRGKIKSKRYQLIKWDLPTVGLPKEWVGLKGSPTVVGEVYTEESEYRNCEILSGSVEQQARTAIKRLIQKGVLL